MRLWVLPLRHVWCGAGMGANVDGLGSGCVDNVTFRNITLDHPSLAGIEIKTEHGDDNNSFVSNSKRLSRSAARLLA